ncbi:NUDIX domain-containing protein [Candidatus Woesearchaeota archaeon]|nr:NUDIX domain-containing protein [Candidatus Woesearchaeota archaeon]
MVREILAEYENLPFRPSVVILAISNGKFLIVGKHEWDKKAPNENWRKVSQGGIESDEDLISAAKREFFEELKCSDIRVLGVSKYTNEYYWPSTIIEDSLKKLGVKYKGQQQNIVVVEVLGPVSTSEEISVIEWISRDEFVKICSDVSHRWMSDYNGVFLKVLDEFNL